MIRDTERNLPKKHMTAQEVEGPFGGAMDFSADPRLSIVTAQYIWGGEPNENGGEMGGMKALDYKYNLNKPIELNETDWYPWGYRGDKIAASRVEAWEFLVGGGSGFNHLNGLFTPEDPAGNDPDNQKLLGTLKALKQFLYSFDFLKMRQDKTVVAGGLGAQGVYCRAISEPGKQYALYIHHSRDRRGSYTVVPGNYHEQLALRLPSGDYRAEWVEPATGKVIGNEEFSHGGGNRILKAPAYSVDIALRIKAR